MRSTLIVFASLAVMACDTTLEAKDYSKTCSADADCVAVFIGAGCQVCGGCSNDAINVSSKAKYDADAKAVASACPPRLGPQPACAPCRQPSAVCSGGTCAPGP
ncbi:MAG: hypothetical protein Q8L14_28930 [Myxococcales bacterium]|nr:hypothetical protein [Myxococcales bacterium]